MTMEKEIAKLLKEIHSFESDNSSLSPLASNTYFLKDERVLLLPRENGVSRFPYGTDGYTIWVYSSGYVTINESTFYVILPSDNGKEPYFQAFAGKLNKDNSFDYHSILRNDFYDKDVKRYCVYGKEAAYFILETKEDIFAVRIFADEYKKAYFTTYAKHKVKKPSTIYLANYFNILLKHDCGESIETKWFKKCSYENDRFLFESPEDFDRKTHVDNYGLLARKLVNIPKYSYNTTSRKEFAGGIDNPVVFSHCLRNGKFDNDILVTRFTDTAIGGDINIYDVNKNDVIIENYIIEFTQDKNEFLTYKDKEINFDFDGILTKISNQLVKKYNSKEMLKFDFGSYENNIIHNESLNTFLKYVIYQTEYCGLAKNSGSLFLGVRDVMQQVQAALIFNPKACRNKIIETLGFIDPTGNPPRQYSISLPNTNPRMDLRPFIDQGVWIISTIYSYLAYSDDYSILNELDTYYERKAGYGVLSARKDSVLDHMIQIMDYLITHIDENTKCLRAMYGDWNDALDGLGLTNKENVEYGNGVSVMASFQLYRNLEEMVEILTKVNKHPELIEKYNKVKEELVEGLRKNAIVSQKDDKKIIHGWGDDKAYLVGSFEDPDEMSRDSSAANSFYYLSRINKENLIDKKYIVNAYTRLDSKYGVKTFEPYFKEDCKGVGRIIHLPKGTAENGATYIHATLFATLSMFVMKEGKMAFAQLEKLLPITHKEISTSPFVMPNSYSYNIEENMDGESMSDWYTGSANTLIKTLVKGYFGVEPTLDGIRINPSNYNGFKYATMNIKVSKSYFKVIFEDNKNPNKIIFDNKEYDIHTGLYIAKNQLIKNKEYSIIIK